VSQSGKPHTLANTATNSREKNDGKTCPQLFLLFECDRLRACSLRISLSEHPTLRVGRGDARSVRGTDPAVLAIPDPWLSTAHAEFRSSFGRILLIDTESKNGCKVNGQRVQRHELVDGDRIELGRTFFVFRSDVPQPAGQPATKVSQRDPLR